MSRSSDGCVERTHDASRRAPGGTDGQHRRAVGVADHEHQRGRVGRLQPRDRGAGRGVAVDDDRLQRVAQRGGDRDLGAGFDLDVVGEPADHAVELAACRTGGAVERERERLGPGAPPRRVGRRVAPLGVGLLHRVLGRAQRRATPR